MTKGNTKKLTLTSVFCALAVILIVGSSIIPLGDGILFVIGSAMMCAVVCECGVRYSAVGFVATALLTSILSADKTVALLFVGFTGWYPIAKLYIERIRNLRKEIILKLIIGLIVSLIFYFGGKIFNITVGWYWILLGTLATVSYDYLLTMMIQIYYDKIRKHIKR